MKTIIAGSRGITSYGTLAKALEACPFTREITEIVSGTARGVDRLGEQFADLEDLELKRFPADWDTFGRSAGYIRNTEMAKYADALVAIWDGESRGTANMVKEAKRFGLKVFIYTDDK